MPATKVKILSDCMSFKLAAYKVVNLPTYTRVRFKAATKTPVFIDMKLKHFLEYQYHVCPTDGIQEVMFHKQLAI